MAFRDDILRGVRLGGMALVVFLAVMLVSRMVQVTAPVESPAPRPAVAVQVPAVSPATVPVTAASPDPPLPPAAPRPSASRGVPIRATGSRAADATGASRPVSERVATVAETEPPEAGQSPTAQDHDAPVAVEPSAQSPTEALPVEEVRAPQAPEGRGKRAIKAVGRFLHLGGNKQ